MPQAKSEFLILANAYDKGLSHNAGPSTSFTVYVICDEAAVRQALESLIASAGWHAHVHASPHEFLPDAEPQAPSCLVLDVALPGLAALELLARLALDGIEMPIICILEDRDVSMTVRLMKAGVSEVLTKPFDSNALLDAIAQALERSRGSLSDDLEVRMLRERYGTLSRREREIMALVVRGRLNKQIAGELGISEITVKAHRGKMRRKMRARSVAQLVVMCARIGPKLLHVPGVRDWDFQRAGDPHQIGE